MYKSEKKKLIMNPRNMTMRIQNSRETRSSENFSFFIFSNHLNTIEVCDHSRVNRNRCAEKYLKKYLMCEKLWIDCLYSLL
jgi:hypothetical protein